MNLYKIMPIEGRKSVFFWNTNEDFSSWGGGGSSMLCDLKNTSKFFNKIYAVARVGWVDVLAFAPSISNWTGFDISPESSVINFL